MFICYTFKNRDLFALLLFLMILGLFFALCYCFCCCGCNRPTRPNKQTKQKHLASGVLEHLGAELWQKKRNEKNIFAFISWFIFLFLPSAYLLFFLFLFMFFLSCFLSWYAKRLLKKNQGFQKSFFASCSFDFSEKSFIAFLFFRNLFKQSLLLVFPSPLWKAQLANFFNGVFHWLFFC